MALITPELLFQPWHWPVLNPRLNHSGLELVVCVTRQSAQHIIWHKMWEHSPPCVPCRKKGQVCEDYVGNLPRPKLRPEICSCRLQSQLMSLTYALSDMPLLRLQPLLNSSQPDGMKSSFNILDWLAKQSSNYTKHKEIVILHSRLICPYRA